MLGAMLSCSRLTGGVGNMNLVSKGDSELGMGFPVTAKWAYNGEMAYNKKMTNLRGLVGGFDEYFVGIIATKKSKITTPEDIAKKKMPIHLATVTKGSMGEFANRQIMEAMTGIAITADVIFIGLSEEVVKKILTGDALDSSNHNM
jgi:TRAP-type uncharacterized transport system substrate-binding protein